MNSQRYGQLIVDTGDKACSRIKTADLTKEADKPGSLLQRYQISLKSFAQKIHSKGIRGLNINSVTSKGKCGVYFQDIENIPIEIGKNFLNRPPIA